MNILILAAVMQASVITFELQPFQDVYGNAVVSQRPFLVIIGADWCPACQRLKQKTVPHVANEGGFRGIEVAYVDLARDEEIAKKLMKGRTIPQVIRLQRNGKKWDIKRLTGAPTYQALTNLAQAQDAAPTVLLTSTVK